MAFKAEGPPLLFRAGGFGGEVTGGAAPVLEGMVLIGIEQFCGPLGHRVGIVALGTLGPFHGEAVMGPLKGGGGYSVAASAKLILRFHKHEIGRGSVSVMALETVALRHRLVSRLPGEAVPLGGMTTIA